MQPELRKFVAKNRISRKGENKRHLVRFYWKGPLLMDTILSREMREKKVLDLIHLDYAISVIAKLFVSSKMPS